MMTFIEKISRLCLVHGYSERALAKELRVHQSAISRWRERGGRPRPHLARRLADLFSVSLEDLMDDSRDLPPSVFLAQVRSAARLADKLKGDQEIAGQAIFELSSLRRRKQQEMAELADMLRNSAKALRTQAKLFEKTADNLDLREPGI